MTALIPDKTFFIQLAIFLAVFGGLSFLVFGPIKRLFALRAEKTRLLIERAQKIEDNIKTISERHEGIMKDAHLAASSERNKIHKSTVDEEARIKTEARQEAAAIVAAAHKKIEAAKVKTMEDLKSEIPKLAEEIIKRIDAV